LGRLDNGILSLGVEDWLGLLRLRDVGTSLFCSS
jgi:hypothetical protein